LAFLCFYDFSIGFWNYSDSVVFFGCHSDVTEGRTVALLYPFALISIISNGIIFFILTKHKCDPQIKKVTQAKNTLTPFIFPGGKIKALTNVT
jgi:hypothetical protein